MNNDGGVVMTDVDAITRFRTELAQRRAARDPEQQQPTATADLISEEQIKLQMSKLKPVKIFNEQTGRFENNPAAPPHIQAQDDECLLEMELKESCGWFDAVKPLLADPKSDRSSFDALDLHWRQYLQTVLQETRHTDGQNFYRIRLLQNLLAKA